MSRNFNLKSSNPNRKNASSYDTLRKLLGIPSTSEGKIFVAKNGSFLEKEFLSKEVSGRKVELDEILPLNWRVAQLKKMFLRCLHQLERKLMMMIKLLLIKLLLKFVGPQGHVLHQSGTATLSCKSCC